MRRWWLGIVLLMGIEGLASQVCPSHPLEYRSYEQIGNDVRGRFEVLKVPVVVHLVLPEGEEISDSRVHSQIDAINRDFMDAPEKFWEIPNQFRAHVRSPQIQFCLARVDPEGAPHSGITRTTTEIPFIGQHVFSDGRQSVHYTILGGKDAWDPDRYVNIWVAEMESFIGRSSFPEEGPAMEDGIVIDPARFGNFGVDQPQYSDGRTAVHELGHYLNLRHPWGVPGCEEDDGIDDTPMQDRAYFGCIQPGEAFSCGSADMVQNLMQFGQDPCIFYFTKGQVREMRAVLESVRGGLVASAGEVCSGPLVNWDAPDAFYNPVDRALVITGFAPSEEGLLEIYDLSGRLLLSRRLVGNYSFKLRLNQLSGGLYVARIRHEGGQLRLKFTHF